MEETEVGKVVRFFSKIGVAAIRITQGELKVGDTIHLKGHTTDFSQPVDSMQVEHASVTVVKAGADVGIKVKEPVREHDTVFRVML
jgi:translation initiation factor IF-2